MTHDEIKKAKSLLRPYIEKAWMRDGRLVVNWIGSGQETFRTLMEVEAWTRTEYGKTPQLTVKQMSFYTGMSTQRIYDVLRDDDAPGTRIGSTRVMDPKKFLRWMRQRKAKPRGRRPITEPLQEDRDNE